MCQIYDSIFGSWKYFCNTKSIKRIFLVFASMRKVILLSPHLKTLWATYLQAILLAMHCGKFHIWHAAIKDVKCTFHLAIKHCIICEWLKITIHKMNSILKMRQIRETYIISKIRVEKIHHIFSTMNSSSTKNDFTFSHICYLITYLCKQ